MKRTSAIVLAIGTVALLLAGCGESSNDATDANGLRKGSSTTSTASAAKPTSPVAATSSRAPNLPTHLDWSGHAEYDSTGQEESSTSTAR